jgi:hypothetical protein
MKLDKGGGYYRCSYEIKHKLSVNETTKKQTWH